MYFSIKSSEMVSKISFDCETQDYWRKSLQLFSNFSLKSTRGKWKYLKKSFEIWVSSISRWQSKKIPTTEFFVLFLFCFIKHTFIRKYQLLKQHKLFIICQNSLQEVSASWKKLEFVTFYSKCYLKFSCLIYNIEVWIKINMC